MMKAEDFKQLEDRIAKANNTEERTALVEEAHTKIAAHKEKVTKLTKFGRTFVEGAVSAGAPASGTTATSFEGGVGAKAGVRNLQLLDGSAPAITGVFSLEDSKVTDVSSSSSSGSTFTAEESRSKFTMCSVM